MSTTEAGQPAGIGSLSAEVRPLRPTDADPLSVIVRGELPHPCFATSLGEPNIVSHSVDIKINFQETRTTCNVSPNPFHFFFDIGPIPAGSYDLNVKVSVQRLCQNPICESTSVGFGSTFDVMATGDVNCDASVNSIDALLILQLTGGLKAAVPCPEAADVNRDLSVLATDAMLILQYSGGLLNRLPP